MIKPYIMPTGIKFQSQFRINIQNLEHSESCFGWTKIQKKRNNKSQC